MKKNLPFLFTALTLLLITEACNYVPNRSNIIAANRTLIDTGVRYIVIQKDSLSPPLPTTADSLPKPADTVIASPTTAVVVSPKPEEKAVVASPQGTAVADFAKTMLGKPYVYGVNTPEKGFDNAGFVNFVFGHFNLKLPKYAPAFIAVGDDVAIADVEAGDIVLFAKTDSVKKAVYQIGIVVSGKGSAISFIQASAGKMNGVGITALSPYYQRKVMGFRRMF